MGNIDWEKYSKETTKVKKEVTQKEKGAKGAIAIMSTDGKGLSYSFTSVKKALVYHLGKEVSKGTCNHVNKKLNASGNNKVTYKGITYHKTTLNPY